MDPVAPVRPVAPVDPVDPVAPVGPAGPAGAVTHALKARAANTAINNFEYLMIDSFHELLKNDARICSRAMQDTRNVLAASVRSRA